MHHGVNNLSMDQQKLLERSKSTASSSSRSFLTRTLRGREAVNSGSIDDTKGPLGLNTLFEPLGSAVADVVFVHGLGGGSQSTWTKGLDTSLFWPQEWLPQDPGFRDVRIHSFGYNSNWDKESTLNVHDFAKSLLGSIQDCPAILGSLNVCAFQFKQEEIEFQSNEGVFNNMKEMKQCGDREFGLGTKIIRFLSHPRKAQWTGTFTFCLLSLTS